MTETASKAPVDRLSLPLASAAVAIAAVLSLTGIAADKLWDDEANTAIFARNLLENGRLTAWDGTNLIGYQDGAELNEELENVYMPPLQYWLAAVGLALRGEGEAALRVPFVITGLLCMLALGVLARAVFPNGFRWYLPLWILAATPAFLLYVRNCRYYAPGAALAIALLACVATPVLANRSPWPRAVAAAVLGALLASTNYLNVVATLAAMPLLYAKPALRNRRSVTVAGFALAGATAIGVYVIMTSNPFASAVPRPDETAGVARFFGLLALNLRDIGHFEFFQVTLLPVLCLPFLLRRLSCEKDTARFALLIAAMMLVMTAVTALFSPQSLSGSLVADMRYLVPLIPLGALVTAGILKILWRLWRPSAVLVGALALLTNLTHLGFLQIENGYLPPRGVQCTLCRYVEEISTDRTTSTEALVVHIEALPADEILLVIPPFMAYSPMYYMPKRRFCCQLHEDFRLADSPRAVIPDRVFWERAAPTRALIAATPPASREGPLRIKGLDMGYYRIEAVMDIPPRDCSRPELPWHSFDGTATRALPHHPFFSMTLDPVRKETAP